MEKSDGIAATMAVYQALRTARFLEGAGLSLHLSGSFGLATFPADGDTVAAILRSADTMMYEAKTTRDNVAAVGRGLLLERMAMSVSARDGR
jgi:predicted signal transduction protein with EAL and GGDEF domain